MVAISRICRFIWFLTFPIFFVIVLLGYFSWPDEVGVYFNREGEATYALGKQQLFYFSFAIMISINLLVLFLVSGLKQLPSNIYKFPNSNFWQENTDNSDYAKMIVINWVYTFVAVLNLFLNGWIFILTQVNLEQYDLRPQLGSYSWLQYLFYAYIILWIGYISLRYLYKKLIF